MDNTKEITVKVTGMTCPHCEAAVKRNIEAMEGIINVEADRQNQNVIISGSNIDLEKVTEIINNLGYKFVG
jgi:copper chaperone CopZ